MINNVLQAASSAGLGGGGIFAQLLGVAGLVLGSGGILAVFTDKMKRKREAERIGAEANKLGIEGQVSISGATLEWARDFRQEARDAKLEAVEATKAAREATAQADGCARDNANLREELADLRGQLTRRETEWDQMLELVRGSCQSPPSCVAFQRTRLINGP
jgi:hypothetical protein